MKILGRVLKYLVQCFSLVVVLGFSLIVILNVVHWIFIDDEPLIVLSPYVSELDFVDRNNPTRVSVQSQYQDRYISTREVLTSDPESIQQLIKDLRWTWVTNFSPRPSNQIYYSISFEDDLGELIYPFEYYPDSDIIMFYGWQNVISINSSTKLKHLLGERI